MREGSLARKIAAGCIVVAGFALLLGILMIGVTEKKAAKCDFIEYWAAGQQLVHHANPYDVQATFQLQRGVALDADEPQVTFSPPVALFMVLPLGFVTPKTGLIVWLLLFIASLLVSVWLLWIMNGRPDSGLHFCGYMFAPA